MCALLNSGELDGIDLSVLPYGVNAFTHVSIICGHNTFFPIEDAHMKFIACVCEICHVMSIIIEVHAEDK